MMIENGWLNRVKRVESPNCDERPADMQPDLIVVHGISLPPNEYGGSHIEALFTNCLNPDDHPFFAQVCNLRVSAHLLIRRDGSLTQFVPFDKRAWHAGESYYQGRSRCNDFSIGIELEGVDDLPYDMAQYQVLAKVIGYLFDTYATLSKEHIVGHSDIASGRKTDPGDAFDWMLFKTLCCSKKSR
ncbi:MAG: 1,6-anhydro-N-acetylmuramyl-L-alanine amidase AmpD [Gammaproteobacteria bacterium]|nr:1,6-anhydro-N-acetylmuramyl-L-alanine amidase AmpD [Gammaproteobacteria bacterium]